MSLSARCRETFFTHDTNIPDLANQVKKCSLDLKIHYSIPKKSKYNLINFSEGLELAWDKFGYRPERH